jgi:hypothetical protein
MSHTRRVCNTGRIGQRLPGVPRPGSDASRSPGRGISYLRAYVPVGPVGLACMTVVPPAGRRDPRHAPLALERWRGPLIRPQAAGRYRRPGPRGCTVTAWPRECRGHRQPVRRALVRAHTRALAEGGKLRLVVPASALVLRMFACSGLDQEIPNFADLEEALQPAPAAPAPRSGGDGGPSRGGALLRTGSRPIPGASPSPS